MQFFVQIHIYTPSLPTSMLLFYDILYVVSLVFILNYSVYNLASFVLHCGRASGVGAFYYVHFKKRSECVYCSILADNIMRNWKN
jgi:hypothetical protein